jgi:hypothetical protein
VCGERYACRKKFRIILAILFVGRKTVGQDEREGNTVPHLNKSREPKSEFVNQIARFNFQSLGDPEQSVQTDPLLSAFNFPHINRVQIRFFRKLFLAQASLFAATPNGVAQDFQLSRTRHGLLAKQDQRNVRTPNMGLFYLADFWETA